MAAAPYPLLRPPPPSPRLPPLAAGAVRVLVGVYDGAPMEAALRFPMQLQLPSRQRPPPPPTTTAKGTGSSRKTGASLAAHPMDGRTWYWEFLGSETMTMHDPQWCDIRNSQILVLLQSIWLASPVPSRPGASLELAPRICRIHRILLDFRGFATPLAQHALY
eukprot:364909-Chlamydomonas_euryale.AAC.1